MTRTWTGGAEHGPALLETDPGGRILRGNDRVAQVTGYHLEDLTGWHLSRLHHEPGGPDVERVLERALARGVDRMEGWQVRPDGSWFWANWVIVARPRWGTPTSGFGVVVEDLTAERNHLALARATAEINEAVREGLPCEGVLGTLARTARELLGATGGAVLTHDDGEGHLLVRAVDGMLRDLRGTRIPLDRTAEGEVVEGQQPLALPDPPGPDGWRGSPLATTGSAAAVLVPVPGRAGCAGLVAVADGRHRRFTATDARTVGVLATQVAPDVARDLAYGDSAQLWATARDKVASEERHRLARELHDSVSQVLYSIGLGARTARHLLERAPQEAGEPIDYILQLTEAGLAEMRALIFELRPHALDEEGLVAALTKQTAALRTRYDVTTHPALGPEPDASMDVKLALYRVTQEAMQNIARHAQARNVTVRLTEEDADLVLEITDDGVGFDPGQRFPGHLGLASMRKRITDVGGVLEIDSAPGAGTRIHARAPRPPG
jgi:PAS domain S-box-containing protein